MKTLAKVALGILTSIGGYLEVGSLGTALQAGAAFRYELLWTLLAGTICLAFLIEMSGRLAAVSHHSVTDAVRERFGFPVQVWPLTAQILIDLLVLASEIGGIAFALELMTGISMRVWAIPSAFVIWLLLWRGTFGLIENGVAILGLVTLSFVVAVFVLHPEWRAVVHGVVPHRPTHQPMQYAVLAVGILGATISPYLVTFYSSGAIEEEWQLEDLTMNRLVAVFGIGFGAFVAAGVMVVAALTLAPRGIFPESYRDAIPSLTIPFGHLGFWLFCGSLLIGCAGAALELSLDLSYILAQTFGWNWGEDQTPATSARFALAYTGALAIATIPSLIGIDPLKLTVFSMALTVVALPIMLAPLLVVMNDERFLESHTNHWITNIAVVVIVLLSFVLAVVAIPVQLAGG